MMIKKEIIKFVNNNENNNISENTFLMDTEKISVDAEKIKKVYYSAKKLELEIMANDVSEKFIKIEIDPYGYTESKRGKKDSKIY